MSDRYTSCIDLHLVLRDGQQRILLGERVNTGFMDGAFHLPAGHLEDGESATTGLIREADEEAGIRIDPADLTLVHTMHHRTNSGRLALFFEATQWSGEVTNREPDKCAGWKWFSPDALPEQMIPYAAAALDHIAKQRPYSERGWDTTQ
ncbi:NUDIX hydrolase [Streptomyces sp. TR02-1]|uniref:NUDIX hydrolase n=1 Tax=Streptomyces sp. TR02-1 TaxID=3385977 RepID=UPI0039A1B3B2